MCIVLFIRILWVFSMLRLILQCKCRSFLRLSLGMQGHFLIFPIYAAVFACPQSLRSGSPRGEKQKMKRGKSIGPLNPVKVKWGITGLLETRAACLFVCTSRVRSTNQGSGHRSPTLGGQSPFLPTLVPIGCVLVAPENLNSCLPLGWE